MRRTAILLAVLATASACNLSKYEPKREVMVRFKVAVDPSGPEAAAVRAACPGGPHVVLEAPSKSNLESERLVPIRYNIQGATDNEWGATVACDNAQPAVFSAGLDSEGLMRRWLLGDQLGPHLLGAGQSALMVESTAHLARKPWHRAKAHLVLSGMRHRAAEIEDCRYLKVSTYAEALAGFDERDEPLEMAEPTSRVAEAFFRGKGVGIVPSGMFAVHRDEFAAWAAARDGKRLLMDDFVRQNRQRFGVLMDGAEPVGGRWSYDAENRSPPPRSGGLGIPEPWWPTEDDVDAGVREDLDTLQRDGVTRFVGHDGPRRFAVTRSEALAALEHFLEHRLPSFGLYEDAILREDPWMAHSLLSVPLNLGLLHPLEVVAAAEARYRSGAAPIAAVEGFCRQVIGWREYVWGLYWLHAFEETAASGSPLPEWFTSLDADATDAACLKDALAGVRDHGWVHHIPRLMVLGSFALQRGFDPVALSEWFVTSFVDGFPWVMPANVIGMSQHADGGLVATKPYSSGGAYIHKMSDHCGGCTYKPTVRLGDDACPFTAGWWALLDRHEKDWAGNFRMAQPAVEPAAPERPGGGGRAGEGARHGAAAAQCSVLTVRLLPRARLVSAAADGAPGHPC